MIQGRPTVSILIPVYNRARLIRDTLQSALAQTYPDFEVVVCDNASTDDTWDVLQEFAGDERIRLFRNSENLGPVKNWRRCLDEARGEYAKILFSDDLMFPRFLEKTLPLLRDDGDVGFVFTAVKLGEDPDSSLVCMEWKEEQRVTASRRFIEDALVTGRLPVSPGAALFRTQSLRKNLMEEVPSPTFSGFGQTGAGPDLLCYLLTAADYPNVAHLAEPLCFFRSHMGSISASSEGRLLESYWQSRLWFAANHADPGLFARARVRAWVALCKREERILPYREVIARFLPDVPRPTWKETAMILMFGIRLAKRHVRRWFRERSKP